MSARTFHTTAKARSTTAHCSERLHSEARATRGEGPELPVTSGHIQQLTQDALALQEILSTCSAPLCHQTVGVFYFCFLRGECNNVCESEACNLCAALLFCWIRATAVAVIKHFVSIAFTAFTSRTGSRIFTSISIVHHLWLLGKPPWRTPAHGAPVSSRNQAGAIALRKGEARFCLNGLWSLAHESQEELATRTCCPLPPPSSPEQR